MRGRGGAVLLAHRLRARGTHWATLGLREGEASAGAIRTAYLRRAKDLHPDSSGEASGKAGEGGAAFVGLRLAYDTLRCPVRRGVYEASLRESRGGGAELGGESGGAAGDEERARRRRRRHAGAPHASRSLPHEATGGLHSSVVARLERDASLRDALSRAFHGPELSERVLRFGDLPECFEADERVSADCSDDLLQLVSGRTLLGRVVAPARPAQLPPSSWPGGWARGGAIGHAEKGIDESGGTHGESGAHSASATRRADDELTFVCAGGVVRGRAVRSAPLSSSSSSSSFSSSSPPGAGAGDVRVFAPCGGLARLLRVPTGGGYSVSTLEDVSGDELATLVTHSSPFVTRIHAFRSPSRRDGSMEDGTTGGSAKGRLMCSASRVTLPPVALWLFPPREQPNDSIVHRIGGGCGRDGVSSGAEQQGEASGHCRRHTHAGGGSWSFEFCESASQSDRTAVVALAAVVALDRERGATLGAAASVAAALRRAAQWAGAWRAKPR